MGAAAQQCEVCGEPRGARTPAEPDWYVALPRVVALSEREREVLVLLAAGMSNLRIAHRLRLTERTVKSHVARILRKLGVESRLQAGLVGYAHQLTEPAPVRWPLTNSP